MVDCHDFNKFFLILKEKNGIFEFIYHKLSILLVDLKHFGI